LQALCDDFDRNRLRAAAPITKWHSQRHWRQAANLKKKRQVKTLPGRNRLEHAPTGLIRAERTREQWRRQRSRSGNLGGAPAAGIVERRRGLDFAGGD